MIQYLRRLGKGGDILGEILRKKALDRKRLVVDFSSPNIAKRFHIGNLRSTLLGDFYCKINRLAGNEVIALNYLGDWGTQMALLTTHWPNSTAKQRFDELGQDATLSDRLIPLMDCYVEACNLASANPMEGKDQALKLLDKMEQALIGKRFDDQSLAIWKQIRDLSIDYLNEFYNRLGIKFDVWDAESYYVPEARRIANELVNSGKTTTTREGLKIIQDAEHGGYSIICKSNYSSSMYLTREIAATIARDEKFNADSYVYVVDQAQTHHFQHLTSLLDIYGRKDLTSKINHLRFGRLIGISTRRGIVEIVDHVLEDGMEAAKKYIQKSPTMKVTNEELPEVCRELSDASLIMNDLKRHRMAAYNFNAEKAFNPAHRCFLLHEKYARLCSLIEKNSEVLGELNTQLESDMSKLSLETDVSAKALFQCLYELDGALYTSLSMSEPSPMVSYLLRVCDCVGSAVSQLRIKDAPSRQIAINRLLLFVAARNVLTEGFQLLGIKPLSKI